MEVKTQYECQHLKEAMGNCLSYLKACFSCEAGVKVMSWLQVRYRTLLFYGYIFHKKATLTLMLEKEIPKMTLEISKN